MALYDNPTQTMLDMFKWDQNGYLVQAIDMHNNIWNLWNFLQNEHSDLYGNINGVLTGLNVTSTTPGMTFAISSGRCSAVAGSKLIGLIQGQAGTVNTGQPNSFTVALTNGSGLSGGQTRIDLICAQYVESTYVDVNGADHVIEGTGLVVIQGTPGTPGLAPALPDSTYVALAAVTVHVGDTTSAQGTIDNTAAGLRVNFPSLVSLLSSLNGLNAVKLQGASPVPQTGTGGVSNVSVQGYIHSDQFIELPYITTPAAGAANTVRAYYKSDGNRYIYDPVYGEQLDIPVGKPELWLSGSLPSGCFWLDGSIFSTVTYPRLAAITNGQFKTGGESVNQDRLPDGRGRAFFGADNFGSTGAANRIPGAVMGSTGGAQTHVQTSGELAAHGHTDSGHDHGFNDPGHGHGLTSSTHSHNVSQLVGVGGISHGGTFQSQVWGIPIPSGHNNNPFPPDQGVYPTDNNSPDMTLNSGATGASIQAGNAVITSNGSSTAMNVMNPYVVSKGWIIRY